MLALLSLLSAPAEACLYLVQHRLFPLGTNPSGQVLALELVQIRDGDPDAGTIWKTTGSLRVLGTDTVLATWPEVTAPDPMTAARQLLESASSAASATAGFSALSPADASHCQFDTACGSLSLASDGEAGQMVLQLEGREAAVHFPVSFLGPANLSQEWPAVTDEEALRASTPWAWDGWSLGSVQRYSSGSSELFRVHIARGQGTPGGHDPIHLPTGVFAEPYLHHGKRFDVIWGP